MKLQQKNFFISINFNSIKFNLCARREKIHNCAIERISTQNRRSWLGFITGIYDLMYSLSMLINHRESFEKDENTPNWWLPKVKSFDPDRYINQHESMNPNNKLLRYQESVKNDFIFNFWSTEFCFLCKTCNLSLKVDKRNYGMFKYDKPKSINQVTRLKPYRDTGFDHSKHAVERQV